MASELIRALFVQIEDETGEQCTHTAESLYSGEPYVMFACARSGRIVGIYQYKVSEGQGPFVFLTSEEDIPLQAGDLVRVRGTGQVYINDRPYSDLERLSRAFKER